MNFKKGDKVKFLNENDHGTVTSVKGNGIVTVLNSYGFDVPVSASELILDPDSGSDPEVEADDLQAKITVRVEAKKAEQKRAVERDLNEVQLWAGFVPADRKALDQCDLDLYFINDSDYRICYNFAKPTALEDHFEVVSGILEPDTKEFIETVERKDLGNLTSYRFQLLFAKDKQSKMRKPEEVEVKLHSPKFYQSSYYKVNDFFDENAVILPIYQSGSMHEAIKNLQSDIDQAILSKDFQGAATVVRKMKRNDKEVVDLHLTEIIEDERGMSPKDKLDYQMKVFREKLDEYIKDPHVQKVVFIHGKGNGTLKLEVRKCLDRYYKRYQYQDASFEEYGGGATLVYVK